MFEWDGKAIETVGGVSDAMYAILRMPKGDERVARAGAFMAAYRADNEHADANVGYLCGYFGHNDMVEALRLFKTQHPIFGGPAAADQMTPDKAFEIGKVLGEGMKSSANASGRSTTLRGFSCADATKGRA